MGGSPNHTLLENVYFIEFNYKTPPHQTNQNLPTHAQLTQNTEFTEDYRDM